MHRVCTLVAALAWLHCLHADPLLPRTPVRLNLTGQSLYLPHVRLVIDGSVNGYLGPSTDLPIVADGERREAVKQMMQHAWGNYGKLALGQQQLNVRTKRGENVAGNLPYSLLGALGTLLVMGLRADYELALAAINRTVVPGMVRTRRQHRHRD